MNESPPPSPIPFRVRLRRLLNRPLFGTVVIPFDARVDPADFPEEEFPIHCGKCDYPLKALPEPRCPECGTPFEPGRRIVEEYYAHPEPHPTLWVLVRNLMVTGAMVGVLALCIALGTHFNVSLRVLNWIVWTVQIVALIAALIVPLIIYRQSSDRQKRDRVRQYLIAQARAAREAGKGV